MARIMVHTKGSRRTLSFEEFERRFLEICEARRAQGLTLVLAFILFDRSHPHMRRMLSVRDYWDALDHITGLDLSVFSFDTAVSDHPQYQGSDGPRAMIAIQGSRLANPAECLAPHFSDVGDAALPCVLFFQVADGTIIDQFGVQLNSTGIESSYLAVEQVLRVAVNSVAKVRDENAENAQEILNLVRSGCGRLSDRRRIRAVWEATGGIGRASRLVGILRGLLGLL